MYRASYIIFILMLISNIMSSDLIGQGPEKPVSDFQIASDELDEILVKSDRILDLSKRVSVRSKAANLMWERNPDESRRIFSKLWKEIGSHSDDKSFDKESSRIDLLEQIFPLDRVLAERLIKEAEKSGDRSDSIDDKVKGTNPETRRLAFLSYRMAERDVVMAAAILEFSLSENTAPSFPLILNRIRESNPGLANYVAIKALDRFRNHAPTIGLNGLAHLVPYMFPMSPSPFISPEAADSDEILRQQYFQTAYVILKQSLTERDEDLIQTQNYSQQTLRMRKFTQTIQTGVLSALSHRYAPEYFVELNTLNIGLLQLIPNEFRGLISMQIAAVNALIGRVEKSELSDAEIINSIIKEDFVSAESLINDIQEEPRKKAWLSILFRAQAKSHIKKGDPHLALTAARKIDNTVMSVPIIVEIAKLANKKKNETLSIMALQTAHEVTEKLKKGMQAKMMFSIAAEIAYLMPEQASTLIHSSVGIVNGLSEIKDEKISYSGENYWNDPDNFFRTSSMVNAFALSGELKMSDTLLIAHRFRDNSLQMLAKLATIERVLKKGPPKINPKIDLEKKPVKSSPTKLARKKS